MGWFTPSKRVSSREMRDVRGHLRSKGFSHSDINNISKVFSGDEKEGGFQHGVNKQEVERGVKWLRENRSKHTLSESQIQKLHEALQERL